MNRRKKVAVATGFSAVAALAVAGGTLAAFTDSDTATQQVLQAGVVQVNLVEGSDWTANLGNLGIADTVFRSVQVDNTSSLEISKITLSADVIDTPGEFGGLLSDAVTVDIVGPGPMGLLAEDVPLSALADGYDLDLGPGLPANTDVNLDFNYEVVGAPAGELGDRTQGTREGVSNPDNKYQGSALTVDWTVDAVQRAGVDQ